MTSSKSTKVIWAPSLCLGGGTYILSGIKSSINEDSQIEVFGCQKILKALIKLLKTSGTKQNLTLWNFDDLILPLSLKNQIYYFDWAYLVYDDQYLWQKMPIKQRIKRKIKIWLISLFIRKVGFVFVQTETMKKRLKTKYSIKNISVLPTPIKPLNVRDLYLEKLDFNFHSEYKNFTYISSYAHHKNHHILIDVAQIIKSIDLPYRIHVTIDGTTGSDFLRKIKELNLQGIIINHGYLSRTEVERAYYLSDAVLIPTLLESYGLPYYEAMSARLPIFTSDLDFARDACKEAAVYFNPFDAEVIVASMKYIEDDKTLSKMVELGDKLIHEIPSWNDFISTFENKTKELLY